MPEVPLTENARRIFDLRYSRKDEHGEPTETPEEAVRRVAENVASVTALYEQSDHGGLTVFEEFAFPYRTAYRQWLWLESQREGPGFRDQIGPGWPRAQAQAARYEEMIGRLDFLPNSPTWTGAGTELGQLAACQPYHAPVLTDRGYLPIGEIVERHEQGEAFSVVAFTEPSGTTSSSYRMANINSTTTFAPVRGAVRTGVKPVLRLRTMGGLDLDVTGDHRVWSSPPSKHGRYGWHRAEEIEVGWMLALDTKPKPFPIEDVIDADTAAVLGWLQTDGYVGWPTSSSSPIVEFETINDEEFAWVTERVARSILSDLHLNEIAEDVRDPDITYRRLRGGTRWAWDLLVPFGLDRRKQHKRVPEAVMRSSEAVVTAYLRSVFQADASVSPVTPGRGGTITLSSVSFGFLQDLQRLLLLHGIVSGIITSSESRDDRLEGWRLHIGVREGRMRFEETIGFIGGAKREGLAELNKRDGKAYAAVRPVTVQSIEVLGSMPVYDIQTDGTFLSNGLVVHNCFVLPVDDDLVSGPDSIYSTMHNAIAIQQTGGGNGFSFGRLRPQGALVKRSMGKASGPMGFARAYNASFKEMAQGGTRRGANMLVLPVHHPDIRAFIGSKVVEGELDQFNISVAITDEFMEAVDKDDDFYLRHDGRVYETIRARDLWGEITENAWVMGDPGNLFIDRANEYNPVPIRYRLEATNPCGEQWLGPYENCCLGSINLANFVQTDDPGTHGFEWERFRRTVILATQFLDDVVDANLYVETVPQLEAAAQGGRRIGLGLMGLADAMIKLGVRYGDEDGIAFASQVTEFARYHCMLTSIERAQVRGTFEWIEGSIYDPALLAEHGPGETVVVRRSRGHPGARATPLQSLGAADAARRRI